MAHRSTVCWILVASACAFAVSGTRAAAAPSAPAPTPLTLKNVAVGVQAPDFTYDVGEGPRHLRDDRGHPVVLNFWATWCAPCLDELPVFDRLARTYGDRVGLISLSDESAGVARTFAAARGVRLPVAEDPERIVFTAYSIVPIPVTIVLDARGVVTHISVGELDWGELSSAVQADLAPAISATPL